jgi:hypothetical protein
MGNLTLPGLLLAGALLLTGCSGNDDDEAPRPSATPVAAGRDSIVIPSLDIDAPLASKAFQVGVPLPSPDGPDDVVLYDFGNQPGLGGAPGAGGNAVMSGRSVSDVGCVRAEPPCNGVFVSLRRIALGDEIEVKWHGVRYLYQVVSLCGVQTSQFTDAVYRRSAEEQLTLLTGVGTLSSSGFSIVLVVIARPAPVTAAEQCPPGTLPVIG